MKRRRLWKSALPDFEKWSTCSKLRIAVANSLRRLGWDHHNVRYCRSAAPCKSGLCPSCIRQLRVSLLDFLDDQKLYERRWHFVTIRVAGWTIAPGDHRPFGPLRDHHLVENLRTKLRRMAIPDLLVFGSIETVYNTVGNVPCGKPFHLHLMIAGLTKVQIEEAVRATIPLSDDPVPLDIVPVPATYPDFARAASYAFKQPVQKRSKRDGEDRRGKLRWPQAAELRELLSNLGVHGWTERLILMGIRCDGGRFRLTANLSATGDCYVSSKIRKSPRRQRRRGCRMRLAPVRRRRGTCGIHNTGPP
jgi:hypothetical protein